jgi:HlyD family secretion protein
MKKIVISLAVLTMLAFAGFAWLGKGQGAGEPRYKTEAVERGKIIQSVSANGTLNPVTMVNVGTQVSGTVKSIHADFNQEVKAGQVLAELDPALFRAALGQSSANLANARAQLKLAQAEEVRFRSLVEQQYASRQELDRAVAAREQAEAAVRLAQAQVSRDQTNLDLSVIRSPVSGPVIDRQVDVGQTVAASFQTPTLFRIGKDLTRMQIDTTVAEADIGLIKLGQEVEFLVDAFPDEQFSGRVGQIRLNAKTEQNVVTYNVVVSVDNPELKMLPGMTANIKVRVQSRDDVMKVPAAALRFRPQPKPEEAMNGEKSGKGRKTGGPAVYKLVNGEPVRVPVKIGISDQNMTEILSGDLKPGDELVVADLSAKKNGSGVGGSPRGRLF